MISILRIISASKKSHRFKLLEDIQKGSKKIKTPFGIKKIDMSYEIPFLAGYNKKGDKIYIDKRLNPILTLKDDREMLVIKYLAIHESVEKHLEDEKGYKYCHAHQEATGVEREAVEADGYPWDEYQDYMKSEIKRLHRIDPKEPVPQDYDEKPEKDDPKDYSLLKTIHKHQKLKE